MKATLLIGLNFGVEGIEGYHFSGESAALSYEVCSGGHLGG